MISEILLIPSIYLGYHTIRLLTTKNPTPSEHYYDGPIDVLIPAHNEENVIRDTIQSVQSEGVRVHVIAHNCTDNTSEIAKEAGAHVIISDNGRTKGEALNDGLKHCNAPVIGVFDADSNIEPGYYNEIRSHLITSGAVQTRVEIRNNGFLPRMAQIEFATYGQIIAGDNGLLAGNGQFIWRDIIDEVGGWTSSLADDTEISLRIKEAGYRIHFTNKVSVYQDAVTNWKDLIRQRTRWSQGNLELIPRALTSGDSNLAIQTGCLVLMPIATLANICFLLSINLATLPWWVTLPLAFSWPVLMMVSMLRSGVNPVWIPVFWAYLNYLNVTVVKSLVNIMRGRRCWDKTQH